MESKYGSPSSQHPRVEVEHLIIGELQPIISLDDVQFVQESGSRSADSTDSSDASSFSSDSSSDEFIQVDHTATPLAMSAKEEEDENVVSNNALILKEYLRSSSSNSRISDVTIESYIPDVSPAQSPPLIQVMERKEDFDPNRIPPSIFEKPSSPMDWSVASNESLFSIHIGNGSFNRDQIAVLGGDVDNTEEFKSGELISSDNFYKSKDPKLPGEPSEVKDIQVPRNFVSSNGIVLEQALGNIPKRSLSKKDNRKAGTSIPSYTHPRKQSRCCCSMSACSCKWLTCPACTCCSSYSCCRSCCTWPNSCCRSDACCCHPTTWPCCNCKCSTWWNLCNCFSTCSNCCSRGFCCCHPTTWPCCNCKCSTWWNLCNCFSTCSNCCSRGCCSTSSWTCSIRNMFCCFSFQRSNNWQSLNSPQRCKCCFSCSCCCS